MNLFEFSFKVGVQKLLCDAKNDDHLEVFIDIALRLKNCGRFQVPDQFW